MPSEKFSSAYLKIERADEIVREVEDFINLNPPYIYVLETDIKTNERATLAKKNGRNLDRLVVRCGELFHNLRSALDQAYYEVISPLVPPEKEREIQFPFSKKESSLDNLLIRRLAGYAGPDFVNAIKSLKPYSTEGGNRYLTLLHEVNITDKHKFPTPAGNFSKIDSTLIQRTVPDFPGGLVNCGAGKSRKDVVWTSRLYNPHDVGDIVPPYTALFHKKLELPVEVWFYIEEPNYTGEVISTMRSLSLETKKALKVMNV